ncbi:MAG: ABC transporter ATP-binding protein [Firmicutes bacterium]|nr:ABC transporter ATP-binding protein [Bacillota bacterium]
MSVLEFKNISLTYHSKDGETNALNDVNFLVKKGEFVAIVGPSGCGKTTILSLIAGLIKQTSGQILIEGKPLCQKTKLAGYMLQSDKLFEWRCVQKNIMLGLEIQSKKTQENIAYAAELINKYGLGEFKDHYPNQLSGGMRQRAALIRTLAFKPKLLLLDEPFSALDFQTRLSVCDDIHSIIKKENSTAVLVTHDISEAISIADRVVVLSKRPATVKAVFDINFDAKTPLLRRESPKFAAMFEKILKHL